MNINTLVRFVRQPYLYGQVHHSLKEKLKYLQLAIVLCIVTTGAVMTVLVLSYMLGTYTRQEVGDLIQPIGKGQNRYLILSLLLIFSPALEEVAFRGMFTVNRSWSAISFSLFLVIVLNFIYRQGFESRWDISGSIERLAISGVMLIFWLCVYFQRDYLGSKLQSQTRVFLMASVVVFATIHVFNYDFGSLGGMEVLFIPAIYILYATLALALTYVRVKCGLVWAMGMHLASNATGMMIIEYIG